MKILNKILFSVATILYLLPLSLWASQIPDVTISGLKGRQLENTRAHLSILQKPAETTDGLTQQYFLIENEVAAALQPYGYYHANVITTREQDKKNQSHHITIDIHKGPATHINNITIEFSGGAEQDTAFRHAKKSFLLHVGDRLIQPTYDAFKESLLMLSNERGYFDARFSEAAIYINTTDNTADIVLKLNSGVRYQFGPVHFSDSPLQQSFLYRFIPFKEGAPFNNHLLQQLQQGLSGNPNFASVSVIPKHDSETKLVPIDIILNHRRALKLQGGLGFGTDTGYRVLAAWQSRRVNDNGHHLENRYQFSEFKDIASLNYTIPGQDPLAERYILSASHIEDRPPKRNSNSRADRFAASYQNHSPDSHITQAFTLQYQTEVFREVDNSERAELLMPIYSIQWRQADDPLFINEGLRTNLELKASSDELASSVSMLQGKLTNRWIKRLSTTTRLLTRAEIGATAQNNLRNIPPSLRFFAGGDNSVRGYAFESLSPEKQNSQGKTILTGGRYLLEGSLELEQHLFDKWRGAVFFDAGNAMNRFNDALKQGAGIGIRWASPIGLIKLDVASALSQEGKPWRIHFSVGPDL